MEVNGFYEFSTYADSILGSNYRGAQLVSQLNYDEAIALEFDNIEAKQRQIYPYLPKGTPREHEKYVYYVFSHRGKKIVIANMWIIPNSIKKNSGDTYTIVLRDVSPTQVAMVRDQLTLLDIDFTIKGD